MSLPWGLACDAGDNVYVADFGNDAIKKYSPDGAFLAAFGSSGRGEGQFTRPAGVAVAHDGYVYVADWGNERVQVLDADGNFVQLLRGEGSISEWAANFLSINKEEAAARATADLNMDIDYFIDDPHEESSHIEKYFWCPSSIRVDSQGRVYVTETNRHRIQIYRRV